MNSEDAFRADGKSGARGTCDGWGMRYRCGALHGQGEHLDRIRREAVCSGDGKRVNTLRSRRRRAAQGGRAIVTRYKCYASRQAASEAKGRLRLSISGCNCERVCGSDDKSGIIDAGDKRRSRNR